MRIEPDLSSARVLVEFRNFVPQRLVLMRADALAAVRMETGGRRRPDAIHVRLHNRGVLYQVDLRALAKITAAAKQHQFVGRDLITRAGLLLLHPPQWPSGARARVILELPDVPTPIHAAVPWDRDIGRSDEERLPVYTLTPHAVAPHSRIAFGRFVPKRVAIDGGEVTYSVLDAPRVATDAGFEAWLQAAMGAVQTLYGAPPVPRTHVIVQPMMPGRGRPIVFGRATLAGGPMVHVMLSGTTTDADMPGEWITIHELLHLGMPVTTLADRWFGEGWVSYYQEIVRARAGLITPQQAWQNMHNWMKRGRSSGGKRVLAEESRLMNDSYAYHRVYWGGAALALKMDVRIRQLTKGQRSLDDVVRYFQQNFVTPGVTVDALGLMRRADAFLRLQVCEPMAREALRSRAFPDLRPTYTALGLAVTKGRVSLRSDAPLRTHRDAIMSGKR
ncbi:MAG: hypothetical protein GY946_04160 [bacterium]|nr:hypothetical protein [bacterium]